MSDNECAAPPIPDGLVERAGRFYFDCRSCGQPTAWEGEPGEFDNDNPNNLCGGSPRCCP